MKYTSLFITAILCIAGCSRDRGETREDIGKIMEGQKKEIPFNKNNWQDTPHIKDRVANKNDVKERKAVFVINPKKGIHTPVDIDIPSLAYHIDQETKKEHLSSLFRQKNLTIKK